MKISLNDINKKYGSNIIFNGFNMKIESGDLLGVFGDSGSGKSTLLNIIGGIEDIENGEVLYNDQKILSRDILNFRRNDVSFIFQNYGLVDNLTVLENIKLLYNFKSVKNSIEETLDELGILSKINEPIFKLSGGEQQRVAIAKAKLRSLI